VSTDDAPDSLTSDSLTPARLIPAPLIPAPLTPSSIRLDGRRALVTGAAQGIGKATALALARFGVEVAVCDKLAEGLAETVAEIGSLGGSARPAALDVRDTAAVTDWVDGLSRDWDELHLLVNNAGGGFHAGFDAVSAGGQAALMAENFTQVADVTRTCLPLLRAGASVPGGASIVNITSVEAHRAGPGFAVYSAMKAGLTNLTKTLALELSVDRIRVNAIAPDMIPTPGDAGLADDSGAMSATSWAMTPWPEEGNADDVAGAVIWLAGPMSRFVTGSTVHVDGGTFAASGWKRPLDGGPWVL
jgi:NAD(P)-dependent dehydrogenase (short-subunit alcohol dehydrogenase family)